MSQTPRSIVAVVADLLFATRILETARQVGARLVVVRPEGALETCRRETPDLVLLDLEASAGVPDIIRAIRRERAASGATLVGFYPHVRQALRDEALAAGLDRALPRSAFVAQLAGILGATTPTTPRPGLID